MKPIYYPYWEWEDFLAGMCELIDVKNNFEGVEKSKSLLTNTSLFYVIGWKVLDDWPKSSDHHLTKLSINRRAWLGQAACCYEFGVCEILTRQAWKEMKLSERYHANCVAEKLIQIYERRHNRVHIATPQKRLF